MVGSVAAVSNMRVVTIVSDKNRGSDCCRSEGKKLPLEFVEIGGEKIHGKGQFCLFKKICPSDERKIA